MRGGARRVVGGRRARRATASASAMDAPVKWMYRLPLSKGRPWMGMPSPRMQAQESGLMTPLLATSSTRSSRWVRWKWVPAHVGARRRVWAWVRGAGWGQSDRTRRRGERLLGLWGRWDELQSGLGHCTAAAQRWQP